MHPTSAIVTRFTNGRLGNNLVTFSHALYCSCLNGHSLYYYPFRHSEKLALSRLYPSSRQLPRAFSRRVIVRRLSDFTEARDVKYEIPFAEDGYCGVPTGEGAITPRYADPDFVRRLRACIRPIVPIRTVVPPSGVPSVAVHLRTGGAYDTDRAKDRFPHKFIDHASCLKMVTWLSGRLRDRELYVHIFTDTSYLRRTLDWFRRHSDGANIKWGITLDRTDRYRMLSDLFSMPNFDYLVRSRSHFSLFAQILGDYRLVLISRDARFNPATGTVQSDGFDAFTPEEFWTAHADRRNLCRAADAT